MLKGLVLWWQAAEAVIVEEEGTVPGEAPGIYACDYKKLAQIHCKVAEGRVELLKGNMAEAEVTPLPYVIVEMRSPLSCPVLTARMHGSGI